MATLHFRSRISQSPPHTLAAGLVLGLALAAGPGWAGAPATAPARASAGGTDRPLAKVAFAGANRDTLPYIWRDVYPVAIYELEDADWTIQREDTVSHRIVTHWKPMKHVLARIFLGTVMARCVVDFAPLPDGRTELVIQGGLTSDGDIEGNSAYSAAVAVYKGATARWLARVRAGLDDRAKRGLVARVALAAPGHEIN
jgi:hypothetical protein